MRAWENRSDCKVVDEPLYASYLSVTGKQHPLAERIVREGESDPVRVIESLMAPMNAGVTIAYQKQMAHHLLPDVPRSWLDRVRHMLLIRDPAEMIPSLLRVTPDAGLEDTGLPQQVEILQRCLRAGNNPPIVDSHELLCDPERILRRLCDRLGVTFDFAMLTWPAGPRKSDGIWADHWYQSVRVSTGFGPPRAKNDALNCDGELYESCMPYYRELYERRL